MNRFDRLSKLAQITVLSFAILLPTLALPTQAAAQTDTKLSIEIKNITISIPNVAEISEYMDNKNNVENKSEPVPVAVEPLPAPVEKVAVIEVKKASTPNYQYPPKVAPEERVYMHEPEIREYLCPKMGQSQCNIFVAILKAENGTHECTRDNRGLNKNGSLDVGLAQINWNPKYNPPYTVEQLRDCKFNLDIALKKYEARGFQPWYAYTKGAYKKFLKPTPKVEVAVAPVQ
jgi:hypothetical protein